MRKNDLNKLQKYISEIKNKIEELKDIHDYSCISSNALKQCRDKLEKSQLKQSIDEGENEAISIIWNISKDSIKLIKYIDKESLRELEEDY